jgi:hypothetical protein
MVSFGFTSLQECPLRCLLQRNDEVNVIHREHSLQLGSYMAFEFFHNEGFFGETFIFLDVSVSSRDL